jgi:hypothetical protein
MGTYDNPTPAQMRGQTHLALAYGAKGIFYYAFQRLGPEKALVDHISLKPLDRKLQTIGELARLIRKHAGLLSSLEADGTRVLCDDPAVETVPSRNATGRYVYAVNKDTSKRVSCTISWAAEEGLVNVRDVFSARDLGTHREGEHRGVAIELGPGEGRLLAL